MRKHAGGGCLLVVENAIPGILGIGHVLAPPNVLHCPNFPPASPRCCCCCTPHCTIVLQNCTPLVQSAASQSEYSTVLNCLPPSPIPSPPTSVNFARPCCTAEHRAVILIKGYTPSFSPSLHTPTPLPNRKPDSAVLSGR